VNGDSFRHELLEYTDGAAGFVRRTHPYISRALKAKEPVLVAVASEKAELLREALGDEAAKVGFTDMYLLGRNPGRIISAWREFLAQHDGGGRALGIGEPIWPGRSAAELSECHRHEFLLNLAFGGGQPWHLLCPYDVDGLDDQVIEAAQHSHPFVAEDDGGGDATAVPCTPRAARPFEGTLPPPASSDVHELAFTAEELGALRHFLSDWSTQQLLPPASTEELVLAVNELATNSIRYGGGSGLLLVWRERDVLHCEIRDAGHIQDPLTGRSRPAPEQHTGRGLWLVHQLCDLVQIRSSAEGSVIRVQKSRGEANEA
jgi:anti-sigma regulatory factor (Ser/Thr protein kinase)